MTRSRSVLGMLVLSALCLCAAAVSNASAAGWTMHTCRNTGTGTGTFYEDAECSVENNSTGTFRLVPLVSGSVSRQVTVTKEFGLAINVGGTKVETACTGVTSPNETASNEEVAGVMRVSGTGKTKFTGCSLTAPTGKGCAIPATFETVELKSVTTASGGIKYEPETGTKFVEFSITGCEGTAAGLNGKKEITGSATSAWVSSASQEFTASSGSTLKFGGSAALVHGKFHLVVKSNGEVIHLLE